METIMATTWLLDKKTSTDHNLTLDPIYQFTAASGDDPNRFLLHFAGVGMGETATTSPVTVYTSGNVLHISSTGAALTGTVYVYNMIGQLMLQQQLGGENPARININAGAGYYLVKVITAGNAFSGKVFINR